MNKLSFILPRRFLLDLHLCSKSWLFLYVPIWIKWTQRLGRQIVVYFATSFLVGLALVCEIIVVWKNRWCVPGNQWIKPTNQQLCNLNTTETILTTTWLSLAACLYTLLIFLLSCFLSFCSCWRSGYLEFVCADTGYPSRISVLSSCWQWTAMQILLSIARLILASNQAGRLHVDVLHILTL